MPVAGVNQTKNTISPTNQDRLGFFLLTEDSEFILTEDNYFIVLDQDTYGITGTNQTKNSLTPVNGAKS